MRRSFGHLRDALRFLTLCQTVSYMLDHGRRFEDDNIHPLDWLAWTRREEADR